MQIYLIKKTLHKILKEADAKFHNVPDIMDDIDFESLVDSQGEYSENLDPILEEVGTLLEPYGLYVEGRGSVKKIKITNIPSDEEEIQQKEYERKEQELYNTPSVKNPLEPTQRLKLKCDTPDIIHPEVVNIPSADRIEEFVKDKITITYDPRDKISKKDLYNQYVQYCISQKITAIGIKSFGKSLHKACGASSGWIQVSYTKETGQIQAKAWCGLKMKDYIEGAVSPVSI